MANSQAIRAGRAFVELFTDDKRLVRGLKAASKKLKAWGASITSLGTKIFAAGAGVLAPLLLSVKKFASAGDELDKMSSRVGASVEFLSALSPRRPDRRHGHRSDGSRYPAHAAHRL